MSGASGSFKWPTREDLQRVTRDAEASASASTFGAALAGELGKLLGAFNDRDTGLVSRRLEHVREVVKDELECAVDILYGGSVAKNTYVSGLSDVDSLLVFAKQDLADWSPSEVIDYAAKTIRKLLKGVRVSSGRLAVTVEYPDGMVLQCLPAVRGRNKLKIASGDEADRWSSVDPENFQKALTRRNQECGSKLVPTIKLAKAINASFPEPLQLTGYHIEARAIQVFRGYEGEKSTAAMLPYFFERASEAVLRPIKDSSGQSVHVDDDLGPVNSRKRQMVSQTLARVNRRMRNATASYDLEQWKALFRDAQA